MLIQCTKKLMDQLKMKPEPQVEEDPLFSWHANLMTINRRKTVVLVNDKNRYVIILHGLKAKDFAKLDEHVFQAIRESFKAEFIKDEIIEQYMEHTMAKDTTYTKTKDRTTVARMNKACEGVEFFEDLLDSSLLIQTDLSKKVSRDLYGNGKNQYIYPNEELYKDLEAFSGQPIFDSKAVELLVTLKLEKHQVWRRLVVPVNRTFREFHKILQLSFGWQECHLYEFYLYDIETPSSQQNGDKPILNIVCDDEFSYEKTIPTKLDTDIKLSEHLSGKIKYNYDFGDNWQHNIEVVNVIEDYEHPYPICLEGDGTTPPEDVGGEYGYEEFLQITADPNHPEYENTVEWAKGQGYIEFNIKMVNWELEKV